jgi:hypothetical protein
VEYITPCALKNFCDLIFSLRLLDAQGKENKKEESQCAIENAK